MTGSGDHNSNGRRRAPQRVGTAVTIDEKLAAAAATIRRMPEAEVTAQLEQLRARLQARRGVEATVHDLADHRDLLQRLQAEERRFTHGRAGGPV